MLCHNNKRWYNSSVQSIYFGVREIWYWFKLENKILFVVLVYIDVEVQRNFMVVWEI